MESFNEPPSKTHLTTFKEEISSEVQHIYAVPSPRGKPVRTRTNIAFKVWYCMRSSLIPPNATAFHPRIMIDARDQGIVSLNCHMVYKTTRHPKLQTRSINMFLTSFDLSFDARGAGVSLMMNTIFFVVSGVNTKIEGGYIYSNKPPYHSAERCVPVG